MYPCSILTGDVFSSISFGTLLMSHFRSISVAIQFSIIIGCFFLYFSFLTYLDEDSLKSIQFQFNKFTRFMNITTKNINFTTTHTITTLGVLTSKTEEIWFVFHGYGQLAEHFIRRFNVLDEERCFVIAPEGLNKFYLSENGVVGSSWMTKQNRENELHNQRQYFDEIFSQFFADIDLSRKKLVFFGFSQGVATMVRCLMHKKLKIAKLIIWAGEIPKETNSENLDLANVDVQFVIGTKDKYYSEAAVCTHIESFESITGVKSSLVVFEGTHEVTREVLSHLI
jgi:predicted esterase